MRSLFLIMTFSFLLLGSRYTVTATAPANDGRAYFATATAIAFGEFPNYKNENIGPSGKQYGITHGAPGTGVMVSPFTFLFRFFESSEKSAELREARSPQSLKYSWTGMSFAFSTILFFTFGLVLLYSRLLQFGLTKTPLLAVIAVVFLSGLPVYVYSYAWMSHGAEFFLQCVMIYLCTSERRKDAGVGSWVVVGIVCGLMALNRFQHLPAMMLWPIAAIKLGMTFHKRHLVICYAVALSLFGIFYIYPAMQHYHPGYQEAIVRFSDQFSFGYLAKRIAYILFETDMGMVFTSPYLLLSVLSVPFIAKGFRSTIFWLFLPVLPSLVAAILWPASGGGYGYRYLYPSWCPVMTLVAAYWLGRMGTASKLAFGSWAVVPFLSMYLLWIPGLEPVKELNQFNHMTYHTPNRIIETANRLFQNPEVLWTVLEERLINITTWWSEWLDRPLFIVWFVLLLVVPLFVTLLADQYHQFRYVGANERGLPQQPV